MYYHKQNNLAFMFPTKTGSSTLIHIVTQWGAVSVSGQPHLKLNQAIEFFPEIETYTRYGFFRNPLDRFLSSVLYLKQREIASSVLNIPQDVVNTYSYDYFVDNFNSINSKFNWYFHPQIDWLKDANPLNFAQFDLEILKLAKLFDVKKVTIPVINQTDISNEAPSQKVIDFVQSYYADDYRLGTERGFLA